MDVLQGLKALASQPRLNILVILKEPQKYFGAIAEIDFQRDGVPQSVLRAKLRVEHPTLIEHMKALLGAGLVVSSKRGRMTLYKRDERRIAQLKEEMVAAF